MLGFDGQRVVVEHEDCVTDKTEVLSVDPLNDPPVPLSPLFCDENYIHPILVLGRHPRISFTLRCPVGCHGPIVVGAPTPDVNKPSSP